MIWWLHKERVRGEDAETDAGHVHFWCFVASGVWK